MLPPLADQNQLNFNTAICESCLLKYFENTWFIRLKNLDKANIIYVISKMVKNIIISILVTTASGNIKMHIRRVIILTFKSCIRGKAIQACNMFRFNVVPEDIVGPITAS